MNFYIADSINEINTINEINISDDNIEFSDELLDFIYKSSSKVSFDMSKLYEVDPYADVEIAHKDLPRIIEICDYILNKSLLEDYDEKDEGNEMLLNLVVIAKKAMKKGLGLVSIGD